MENTQNPYGMKVYISVVLAFLLMLVCCSREKKITPGLILQEIEKGNYTLAEGYIDAFLADSSRNEKEASALRFEKERMYRIRQDFCKTREEVLRYIRKYYPEVNDSMVEGWEKSGALEMKYIDGKKKYFRNAAPNLFRIDSEARDRKIAMDGNGGLSGSESVNAMHLPAVMQELKQSGGTMARPVRMKVKYVITVDTNAVPEGEFIFCWLPYPREDCRRQGEVRLLATNPDLYVLSPVETSHRTIYMKKKQVKDQPTVFSVEFSYSSAAEWFNLSEEDIQPYDTTTDLYRKYTSERYPHIVFSERIRDLSRKIVGNEQSPLLKVRKIFKYIHDYFPWASAREYSTVRNIPEYVLENGHGDCGMVSLLFITMARLNGIPARWQSGFMMHPKALNLHDWAEIYYEGVGWIPVDESFGIPPFAEDEATTYFFSNGIDAYRWVVNSDFSAPLYPAKQYPRSETVDFQRGEVEWKEGNLYFDKWSWDFEVEYE